MIRDYEIEYGENGIQIAKGERFTYSKDVEEQLKSKQVISFDGKFTDLWKKYTKQLLDSLELSTIIVKYAKTKGDMLVFENISRKKNKKDFQRLERLLNEYQRKH